MADLEARVVRTIGDPDIRFREDPVRILRAVKFAARCDLTIEPETYRRMMEHRGEIAKCAQPRVSEEFYRLLRAGAAKRSMELLRRDRAARASWRRSSSRGLERDATADEAVLRRARFWGYLAALDRSTDRRPVPPSNALILAVMLLPPLRDALDPDTNGVRDIGQLVAQAIAPALERLRPSRRDSELARQILLALRCILPSKNPAPAASASPDASSSTRPSGSRRSSRDAEAADPTLAGRPSGRGRDRRRLDATPTRAGARARDAERRPSADAAARGGRGDRDRSQGRAAGSRSSAARGGERLRASPRSRAPVPPRATSTPLAAAARSLASPRRARLPRHRRLRRPLGLAATRLERAACDSRPPAHVSRRIGNAGLLEAAAAELAGVAGPARRARRRTGRSRSA